MFIKMDYVTKEDLNKYTPVRVPTQLLMDISSISGVEIRFDDSRIQYVGKKGLFDVPGTFISVHRQQQKIRIHFVAASQEEMVENKNKIMNEVRKWKIDIEPAYCRWFSDKTTHSKDTPATKGYLSYPFTLKTAAALLVSSQIKSYYIYLNGKCINPMKARSKYFTR